LLCREEHINPLEPVGSYAGAMGMPQFMPSSFSAYAIDYDNDGHRDIWHDNGDVIASVANYFVKHHWKIGESIAIPVNAAGDGYKAALNGNLKPDLRLDQLESLNLKISRPLPLNTKVKLLAFERTKTRRGTLGGTGQLLRHYPLQPQSFIRHGCFSVKPIYFI